MGRPDGSYCITHTGADGRFGACMSKFPDKTLVEEKPRRIKKWQ